jgi:hypothetical protein
MPTTLRRKPVTAPAAPKMSKAVRDTIKKAFTTRLGSKDAIKDLTNESDAARDVLMPLIQQYGVPYGDQSQHLAILLDEPILGKTAIVRQSRVVQSVDVDKAEKIATRKGVLDKVQTLSVSLDGIPAEKADALDAALKAAGLEQFADVIVRREFSQDRFYALHQTDKSAITEKDIDSILVDTVSYSLVGGV